jgi:hypothetical protein
MLFAVYEIDQDNDENNVQLLRNTSNNTKIVSELKEEDKGYENDSAIKVEIENISSNKEMIIHKEKEKIETEKHLEEFRNLSSIKDDNEAKKMRSSLLCGVFINVDIIIL